MTPVCFGIRLLLHFTHLSELEITAISWLNQSKYDAFPDWLVIAAITKTKLEITCLFHISYTTSCGHEGLKYNTQESHCTVLREIQFNVRLMV